MKKRASQLRDLVKELQKFFLNKTRVERPQFPVARNLVVDVLEDRRLLALDAAGLTAYDVNDEIPVAFTSTYEAAGKLVFAGSTPATGREILLVDPETKAVQVVEVHQGTASSDPTNLAVFGDTVYFSAYDAIHGFELRWFDASEETPTVFTLDVFPGPEHSHAGYIYTSIDGNNETVFNNDDDGAFGKAGGKLFFKARDASGHGLRWIDTSLSNPTVNTIAGYAELFFQVGDKLYFGGGNLQWIDTTLDVPVVHTIPNTSNSGDIGGFHLVETRLFFSARDSDHGEEIRWIDTTELNPTVHTIDVNPGSAGSRQNASGSLKNGSHGFAFVGNRLFFDASDPVHGRELRWIDPLSDDPTINTIEINPGTDGSLPGQNGLIAVNEKLYFTATNGQDGNELHWVDTANMQVRSMDIAPGTADSDAGIYGFGINFNKLYFTATEPSNGHELRWIDTEPDNPTLNTIDIYSGHESGNAGILAGITAISKWLFFDAGDGSVGSKLRAIDTTLASPPVEIIGGISGASDSKIDGYWHAIVNDRLFFVASDPMLGTEVMWLDSDTQSVRVIDINPGPKSSVTLDQRNHQEFAVVGSRLFFTAFDETHGIELRWIETDESTPTVRTVDVAVGEDDSYAGKYGFSLIGEKLFFSAWDPIHGAELRWIDPNSDSPVVNTVELKEGANGSNPGFYAGFTTVDDRLYFVAHDNAHGFELRWLDANFPTEIHTVDVNPSSSDGVTGDYFEFANIGNKLYFVAEDANGRELRWINTAIDDPSFYTLDIFPGSNRSSAGATGFQVVGSKLYFGASDPEDGFELRWIDATETNPILNTLDIHPTEVLTLRAQVDFILSVRISISTLSNQNSALSYAGSTPR